MTERDDPTPLPPDEETSLLDSGSSAQDGTHVDPTAMTSDIDDTGGERTVVGRGFERFPEKIGSYRVVREIGRGGMGIVLLAESEDERFRRRVAIKLLKRGVDTEDVLRRFELERQLLAVLNHPGIARLYEGGETEDGRPYLVMEHIEGLELTEYCDAQRLNVEDRLTLFSKICDAVHYAHKNLVVHRDLKPSNILVTTDGQPKLLDFGIAKIINPEYAMLVAPTGPEFRIMTPEYASPEQVRGHPITTSSDVYSLGVMLYQMLTGHAPYHLKSRIRDEIERVVCNEDPERPSTAISKTTADPVTQTDVTPDTVSRSRTTQPERLRRRLSGDLDNIVLKAMRKEPDRRYTSAQEFAADIGRHRDGLPVSARPDTMSYRVTKFVQRHRAGVGVAALFVLLLVAGVIGTSSGWRSAEASRLVAVEQRELAEQREGEAETQRQIAERRFDAVRELARTFLFDLHDEIQTLDGAMPARELMVTTALEYLDDLSKEVANRPDLQRELAAAYERVGDIRGGLRNPSQANLGDALASYQAGVAVREQLLAESPDDSDLARDLAMGRIRLADALLTNGRATDARTTYGLALETLEKRAETEQNDASKTDLAVALLSYGAALNALGEKAEALEHYTRTLELRRALLAGTPGDPARLRAVSVACLRVGARSSDVGLPDAAIAHYEEAVAIRTRLSAENPDSGRFRRDLSVARSVLGSFLLGAGRLDDALPHLEANLIVARQHAEDNPDSGRAQRDLALAYEAMGRALAQSGNDDDALAHYRSFESIVAPLTAADASNAQYAMLASLSHERIAESLAAQGDPDGAATEGVRALGIMERLLQSSDDLRHESSTARLYLKLGGWYRADGRRSDALSTLQKARQAFVELRVGHEDDLELLASHVETLRELARLLEDMNDVPAAIAVLEEAKTLDADDTEIQAELDRLRSP